MKKLEAAFSPNSIFFPKAWYDAKMTLYLIYFVSSYQEVCVISNVKKSHKHSM